MNDASRILAIDDDQPLLTFLEHALTELGVEVVTSQSANEGVRLYKEVILIWYL
jgi:ActR/RegA family two-component response regulator